MARMRKHNAFTYRLEMLFIRLRDIVRSPAPLLAESGIQPGMKVLDFGCGPGGFTVEAARLTGPSGRVYAVDVQPLALRLTSKEAQRRGLMNVQAMTPEEVRNLPRESVDIALLYDVLHISSEPRWAGEILSVLHSLLKPNGSLSIRDHHLKDERLVSKVTDGGLFSLAQCNNSTTQFIKVEKREGIT